MDYGLDPAHYYTLPGFTFDACLKFTGQELDLFTDSEKFLFIENSISGGISVVSHRHVKANNPLIPDYDYNFPHSYLTYLDSNNLYGGAMSEALPTETSLFYQKTRSHRWIWTRQRSQTTTAIFWKST